MTALLEVTDLAVRYAGGVPALRGVSFRLDRGGSLAVVGESGAGKTTLALSLVGLIQPPQATGSVRLDGEELLGASDEVLRRMRWATIALGLQGSPFNPVTTVGEQIAEPMRDRLGMSPGQARARAEQAAQDVLLDPGALERYPHELSGGQRRRALIAMTLVLDPVVIVLDEPTAGLDPVSRDELLERLSYLAGTRDIALIVICHELPDAGRLAERKMVLYAGKVMELGNTERILEDPTHPYTWGLVSAYPVMSTTKDLRPIRGTPPDPRDLPPGCPFYDRCTQAEDECWHEMPPLEPSNGRLVACHFGGLKTMLSATAISKTFRARDQQVVALRDVSVEVRVGESLGVVGPSGSGKTTLARILAGHLEPEAGAVHLRDAPLAISWKRASRALRRRIQLVMQDPWDALSPRLSVLNLVGEPLDVGPSPEGRDEQVREALASVGLPSSGAFLRATTDELSGGQLQRVALARALVVHPDVLVADEPTSMLDASEQARLLVVLRERQVEMGLALIVVSHDIALVRKVTDRIVVLDAGRVVEAGPSHRVSTRPDSATARRLVAAAPTLTSRRSGVGQRPAEQTR